MAENQGMFLAENQPIFTKIQLFPVVENARY